MRTKVTLVLLFLNVALFFFIFHFEREWRTEQAALESRRRVLGPEAANLQSLEITGPTLTAPVRLVRQGEELEMETNGLIVPQNPPSVATWMALPACLPPPPCRSTTCRMTGPCHGNGSISRGTTALCVGEARV